MQAGLGTHYNFTSRFDASLQAQYMVHLGNDINTSFENGIVTFAQKGGVNLEGHILVSLSVNYKLADLW